MLASTFKIVMLPDTQRYSQEFPSVFNDQTQWVANQINQQEENIVFLTQVGDIVNDNTTTQWSRANTAMGKLDNAETGVPSLPYGVSIGNHDFDYSSSKKDLGFFAFVGLQDGRDDPDPGRFGPARYAAYAERGWDEYGYSDAPEIWGLNHYQVFTAVADYEGQHYEQQFLNISLEWEPRQESINWAQQVIDDHPDLPVILSTHEYVTTGRALPSATDESRPHCHPPARARNSRCSPTGVTISGILGSRGTQIVDTPMALVVERPEGCSGALCVEGRAMVGGSVNARSGAAGWTRWVLSRHVLSFGGVRATSLSLAV